ncbi:MAG TPA: hypothetical protein VIU63_00725 [Nitrospira sp.]
MKISAAWKGTNSRKKKNRPVYKPKIRWELLGLSDPDQAEPTTTIETIRKEVSSLASLGFGQGTLSRSTSTGKARGRARQKGKN